MCVLEHHDSMISSFLMTALTANNERLTIYAFDIVVLLGDMPFV